MQRSFQLGARTVGDGHPVLVVAEISANHNGSLALAHETVEAAAQAGADAIKLQTYTPDTITFDSDAEPFQVRQGTLWDGRTLYDLYSEGMTPWEWHAELFDHATALGMEAFSSPFDATAVAFLSGLQVPAFKIASFEIVDIPLVRLTAEQGRPIILSTGIATEDDIRRAVDVCHEVGNHDVIVLKCTSAYPAPFEELNLRTVADIGSRFECLVGLSDHTVTPTASLVAVALGACVVERHIILDRSLGGLDSQFSTDASEFADLVTRIREAELALGNVTYEPSAQAAANRKFARSLFVVADVAAGDVITEGNVRSIRPSDGLPPRLWDQVHGRRFRTDVAAGTALTSAMVEGMDDLIS